MPWISSTRLHRLHTLATVLVTVFAPRLMNGFWEYHIGLLATTLLVLWILFRDRTGSWSRGHPAQAWAVWAILGCSWIGLAFVLGRDIRQSAGSSVEATRNFFGVLRVQELFEDDPAQHQFSLVHGRIEHGFQYVDAQKRNWPVSYYGPYSGLGRALLLHPLRLAGTPMRVGVIRLGAGVSAV